MIGIGNEAEELGQHDRAIEHLEGALAMLEKLGNQEEEHSLCAFALANALWRDPVSRSRARALARTARDEYRASGLTGPAGEVSAWMTDHGIAP
jgi:hypothetical protein